MGGYRLPQREAAQRARQKIAADAAQGRALDQWLHQQAEAEKAAADPNYVRVPWADNPFDPNYYINASQTRVGPVAKSKAIQQGGAWPANSITLRQALVHDGGVPDPTKWGYVNQAHHIVESSNDDGKEILKRFGIELNSAVNGVFLPTKNVDGISDLTTHLGSHTGEYTECINRALGAARDRALGAGADVMTSLVDRLFEIRRVLLTRVVPLNGGVDPDYNPGTEEPMSVTDIFGAEGLFR